MIGVFLLTGCQAAYHVKPENLAKEIDSTRSLKLTMPDKSSYQLADIYSEHRGLVLIFWQTSCPCVKRYQARINDLFERYSPQGIAFAHVSSNQNETFEDAQAVYDSRGISIPLMRDENSNIARILGVKTTPTAVLINSKGDVEFLGWIDNEHDVNEKGRQAYLENALSEMITEQPITQRTSPMFGCPIR